MEDALTIPKVGRAASITERTRPRWSLDRDGFDALLAALDPDRNVAAQRYSALRERLSRFFTWNNAEDPDAQADEVLDRVTRRVSTSTSDDESVRQPEKFAAGVARMLLREGWRADLAIFDPDDFKDLATYADPHRYPSGARTTVIVNGMVVVDNAAHTGATPGMVLRRGADGVVG